MTDSRHTDAATPPTPLAPNLIAAEVDGGRIAENILQFARLLRAAGLPVGPDRVILATQAVLAAGIERPQILYWTLHASLVSRPTKWTSVAKIERCRACTGWFLRIRLVTSRA